MALEPPSFVNAFSSPLLVPTSEPTAGARTPMIGSDRGEARDPAGQPAPLQPPGERERVTQPRGGAARPGPGRRRPAPRSRRAESANADRDRDRGAAEREPEYPQALAAERPDLHGPANGGQPHEPRRAPCRGADVTQQVGSGDHGYGDAAGDTGGLGQLRRDRP